MRSVVITGLGFISSIGNDQSTVLDSLRHLRHGIATYPPFDAPNIPVKVAATIKDFNTDSHDPEDWTYPQTYKIRRETLRSLAPHGLYAWCAIRQAMDDAALTPEALSSTDTGLYTASAGSASNTRHFLNKMFEVGIMRTSPLGIVASIAGTLSFNLVAAFKILGSSAGFVSACASSGHAIGSAWDEIALGRQNRMIVVGAEDGNLSSILPFAGMRALSLSTDPATASRPFDKDRDGFVGSGGATALILEAEETARARQAPIYARILSWGQASDGHSVAISHPQGDGLARAMRLAIQNAGLQPQDIGYINAHATSTPIGDLSEIRALDQVFGDHARPYISSTKALTGHGLSLASALETGLCALASKHHFVPGSAHIENLDPAASNLNIPRTTLDIPPGNILTNSSGFGGANVSIVLGPAGA